jgi:hypothetical protein
MAMLKRDEFMKQRRDRLGLPYDLRRGSEAGSGGNEMGTHIVILGGERGGRRRRNKRIKVQGG